MNRIFYILMLMIPLTAGDISQYHIDFLGVHVADVAISRVDTMFEGRPGVELGFETKTTQFTSAFFLVENSYKTIIDPSSYRILDFRKESRQPGLVNHLSTYTLDNGDITYVNTEITIPDDAYNIFTLLDKLRLLPDTAQEISPIPVEKEGVLFTGTVSKIDQVDGVVEYDLLLKAISTKSNPPAISKTDIFTWAVFKEGATRRIWVDTGKSEIIRCEFTVGFIKMTAVIMDDK